MSETIMKRIVSLVAVVGASIGLSLATPPSVFKDPFRQSPVRAEPGDLLMIAGSGFAAGDRVAYQLVTNTTNVPNHPSSIPGSNTATSGEATVVLNAPDALTITLPAVMTANQSYVFWVKNTANQWSPGVLINDARPLWISPENVFATQLFGGLPRKLKVVGRNLQPATGGTTHVRLKKTGLGKPVTYDLIAENDNNAATAIERYAAVVTLPATMTVATYSIEVNRDGTSWVALSGQNLTVAGDVDPFPEYSAGLPCLEEITPGCDDTAVIAARIATAASLGGGTVVLGAGVWKLGNSGSPAPNPTYGLILPIGVSIRGAGTLTTIERRANWNALTLFTLMGGNEVKNIKFKDTAFHPAADKAHRDQSFLQLGPSAIASWGDPTVIDTVMIHDNTFDNGITCLREGGFPIRHLYVVNNTFGGWYNGIYFAGSYYGQNDRARFDLRDSIITGNTFKPGGYYEPAVPPSLFADPGSIATEIGAGYRLDVSDNVIDGHATDYIYGSPPGFRAGFFTHMSNNHEMVLFSKNHGACTGDRSGEGEFIGCDFNVNTLGFSSAVSVVTATASSVTATGVLKVTSPADYYANHWIQIVSGPGLGQVRKITSYSISPGQVTFNVSPPWDVGPTFQSRMFVARELWQAYFVDNTVDNTGCTLNASHPDWFIRPESGEINLASPVADSVIEGNTQIGASGIYLTAAYTTIPPETFFIDHQETKLFVEVRGNTITGEVNHDAYCSQSGIVMDYSTSDQSESPVLAFGVSIGRNTIDHSDGLRGGAISLENGYYTALTSYPLLVNTLIHNNTILNFGNDPPTAGPRACDSPWTHRRGIHLHKRSEITWGDAIQRTVLSGNSYPASLVCQFLDDGMFNTVNLDTPPAGGWCPAP
jgi:hypothetical protein